MNVFVYARYSKYTINGKVIKTTEDKIDIIDYKLNNIKDDNYLKQLNGYKKYISSITSKPINLYLYSIISETLEKI